MFGISGNGIRIRGVWNLAAICHTGRSLLVTSYYYAESGKNYRLFSIMTRN
jgi:hypothetical protein